MRPPDTESLFRNLINRPPLSGKFPSFVSALPPCCTLCGREIGRALAWLLFILLTLLTPPPHPPPPTPPPLQFSLFSFLLSEQPGKPPWFSFLRFPAVVDHAHARRRGPDGSQGRIRAWNRQLLHSRSDSFLPAFLFLPAEGAAVPGGAPALSIPFFSLSSPSSFPPPTLPPPLSSPPSPSSSH